MIRVEPSETGVILRSRDGIVELQLGEAPPADALPILELDEGTHEIEVDRASPAAKALGLFFPSPALREGLTDEGTWDEMLRDYPMPLSSNVRVNGSPWGWMPDGVQPDERLRFHLLPMDFRQTATRVLDFWEPAWCWGLGVEWSGTETLRCFEGGEDPSLTSYLVDYGVTDPEPQCRVLVDEVGVPVCPACSPTGYQPRLHTRAPITPTTEAEFRALLMADCGRHVATESIEPTSVPPAESRARTPAASGPDRGEPVVKALPLGLVRTAVVRDGARLRLAVVESLEGTTLQLRDLPGERFSVEVADQAAVSAALADEEPTLHHGQRLAFVHETHRLLGIGFGPEQAPSRLEIVAVLDLATNSIPSHGEQPGWRLSRLAEALPESR